MTESTTTPGAVVRVPFSVTVSGVLEIDVTAWAREFGTEPTPEAVAASAREDLAGQVEDVVPAAYVVRSGLAKWTPGQ